MNKVIDQGFTGDFFVCDARALVGIAKNRVHNLDVSDYLDKNKAEVLKEYLKDIPNDELYIIEAYISVVEFPIDKYCLYDTPNKRYPLIPIDKVLTRENKIMEAAGFVNVNDYVDYEYKTAFVYPNEIGKKLIEIMKQKVVGCKHKKYYATNICWDVSDPDSGRTKEEEEEILSTLPQKMCIPDRFINEDGVHEDAVSDWISDEAGYCHTGFEIKEENA